MKKRPPQLHAVTDDAILELNDFLIRATSLAASEHIGIQLRGRAIDGRTRYRLGRELLDRCTDTNLFINDRIDIAMALRADVHLPSHGVPVNRAKQLLSPDTLVGRSTHSAEEARSEIDGGADYVFLGPIWPTKSHPDNRGIGPAAITAALPGRIIAIGGITPERARICREAGAYGVAAISCLWSSSDPDRVASEILLSLEQ